VSEKISSEHLCRAAYVYVRQSSAHQVRHHQESRRRQYDLADRAKAIGFAKTVVIDEDQGKSGSGLHERPGFGQLLAAVCAAEAGIAGFWIAAKGESPPTTVVEAVAHGSLDELLLLAESGKLEERMVNHTTAKAVQ